MIRVKRGQGLNNLGQEQLQEDLKNVIKKSKKKDTEKDKRLEEKMKELGLKCAKSYLTPFNFRGKYYTFLEDPQLFIKQKQTICYYRRLKQNLLNKIMKSAEQSYGFKINSYSRKLLKEFDYLKQLNIGNIKQIQKIVDEIIVLQYNSQNIRQQVIELMDKIEQQNGVKRQRYLICFSQQQQQKKDHTMIYEGAVLCYAQDSERFMEYRNKKKIIDIFFRRFKKPQTTHQEQDNNGNLTSLISGSKQSLQDEEPPLQKYQRYIKNIHTQILRLTQKKDLLLKKLYGQTHEPQKQQYFLIVKNARGRRQKMNIFTPSKLKIGSKAESVVLKDIQQEEEQADVSDESSIQNSDYEAKRNCEHIKQEQLFEINYQIEKEVKIEELSSEGNKSPIDKKNKRKRNQNNSQNQKVLQKLKNLKTHGEKVKYLQSYYVEQYLENFSLRGINYNYREDPEEFLKQKRIKNYLYLHPEKVAEKSNPLNYLLQSKIQSVQQIFNTSYKEGIHKDDSQYHKRVEQLIPKVNKLQKKCYKLRQSVIELMRSQKFKEGLTRQEKEKILCIEPDPVCSEFELFDRYGVNSPAYKDVYDEQKKKMKVIYNFWFEGVFFDYEQDPNRLKKYMKKKQQERDLYLYTKMKKNGQFDGKGLQIKTKFKSKRTIEIFKKAEKFEREINNKQYEGQQNHVAKLEKSISNLIMELKRLKTKKQRLMKLKNDQDEKEKTTEDNKEQLQREKNMSDGLEKEYQNINPRIDSLENINREEGQESDSHYQRQNKFLRVKTPRKISLRVGESENQKTQTISYESQEEGDSSIKQTVEKNAEDQNNGKEQYLEQKVTFKKQLVISDDFCQSVKQDVSEQNAKKKNPPSLHFQQVG